MLNDQQARDVMNGAPHFAAGGSAGGNRSRIRTQLLYALLLMLLGFLFKNDWTPMTGIRFNF
jgi:hypothetical protein